MLLVVDRVVQIDRESAERSSGIARLRFSEMIRASVSDCADERSKSVVAIADLLSDLRREMALLFQPRQSPAVLGFEVMREDWLDQRPNPGSVAPELAGFRIAREPQPRQGRIEQVQSQLGIFAI